MKRCFGSHISLVLLILIATACHAGNDASSYLLRVTKGTDAGKSLIIDMKTERDYTLGRYRDNDLTLFDVHVSRRHARMHCAPAGCTIIDVGTDGTGSTNGTFLNGKPLDANTPAPLRDGDVILLGRDTELLFDTAKAL